MWVDLIQTVEGIKKKTDLLQGERKSSRSLHLDLNCKIDHHWYPAIHSPLQVISHLKAEDAASLTENHTAYELKRVGGN